jgi:monolysocardiolipin acyltransferase
MAVQRLERGDLWKSKAIALKIQLRDRFRVAVDNRRRRRSNLPAMFSGDDGYLSIIVDRWLRRFRDFRKESLPSSSTFYRKRGFALLLLLRFDKVLFLFFETAVQLLNKNTRGRS